MTWWWSLYLLSALLSTSVAVAELDPKLVGTWTTKSRKVLTGPGFYDPIHDKLIEPSLTGISYSFTADGFYEEAHYRALANPADPKCPRGIMQFQHGQYALNAAGSLKLRPFAVDGRQLMSDPCKYSESVYTRYNQTETFKKYEVITDEYNNMLRLNLFKYDGAPMNPMWLAYRPPQMLPTKTLNPTAQATGGEKAKSTSTNKAKRSLEMEDEPLNKNALRKRQESFDLDYVWWLGVSMTALGGVGYLCF
ncbi:MAG: Reversal of tor2 lethality [Piccolia ochrophora]|nr:MAG: Reversal of tor2 lethality [Piccolia ochrophora]